jgi:hypothetical protein
MVAFSRPYIANPDLVERLATDAPLAEVDWETVYGAGRHGYSDYPIIRLSARRRPSELNTTDLDGGSVADIPNESVRSVRKPGVFD